MSGEEGLRQVSKVKCEAGDADSGASDSLSAFACHIFPVTLCTQSVCVFSIAPNKHHAPETCTSLTCFEISAYSWTTGKGEKT